jgi:hypothetical protein
MTKKRQLRRFTISRTVLLAAAATLAVAISAGWFVQVRYIERYDRSYDQANGVVTRELILRAAEGTKTPAPVDPKTGDIYFPEARLYLPSNQIVKALTYGYGSVGENGQDQLSISSRSVFNRTAARLYTAQNTAEMFSAVSQLQSCQRGMKLSYTKLTQSSDIDELKQTVILNSGHELYVYVEKDCSQLNDLAIQMKAVQAY